MLAEKKGAGETPPGSPPLTRGGEHLPEEGAHPGGCGPQPRSGAALAWV